METARASGKFQAPGRNLVHYSILEGTDHFFSFFFFMYELLVKWKQQYNRRLNLVVELSCAES